MLGPVPEAPMRQLKKLAAHQKKESGGGNPVKKMCPHSDTWIPERMFLVLAKWRACIEKKMYDMFYSASVYISLDA